ncbi:MAG: hypothetical protein WCE70_04985, partial [Rhodanobacteraceae bacterium]
DPAAHTAGLLKVILFTILLTPYESSLVLPAKNLWISRRIVRALDGPANNVGNRRGGRVCRSR